LKFGTLVDIYEYYSVTYKNLFGRGHLVRLAAPNFLKTPSISPKLIELEI